MWTLAPCQQLAHTMCKQSPSWPLKQNWQAAGRAAGWWSRTRAAASIASFMRRMMSVWAAQSSPSSLQTAGWGKEGCKKPEQGFWSCYEVARYTLCCGCPPPGCMRQFAHSPHTAPHLPQCRLRRRRAAPTGPTAGHRHTAPPGVAASSAPATEQGGPKREGAGMG